MIRRISLLLVLLLGCPSLWAHGDIHHQMDRLEHKIAHDPTNIDLRLQRGQMLLIARHGEEAYAEFKQILELAPQRFDVLYQVAQSQLLLHQVDAALASVDTFLQKADNDASRVRGLLLQGEILSVASQWQQAGAAYRRGIELSNPLEPDSVLLAVDAYRQAGQFDQAFDVLNVGMTRLGALQAFEDQALELEMQTQRYDAALSRVDRMLSAKLRLPFLLYRKGQILERLSRKAEAKQTYEQALQAIAAMPAAKQKTSSIELLKSSLVASLQAIPAM